MNPTETPLTTLIKEMREAREEATPGPWWFDDRSHHEGGICYGEKGDLSQTFGALEDPASCEFVALCNPENIRRVLDACDEMREALVYYGRLTEHPADFECDGIGLIPFGATARAVLARHFPEESK